MLSQSNYEADRRKYIDRALEDMERKARDQQRKAAREAKYLEQHQISDGVWFFQK